MTYVHIIRSNPVEVTWNERKLVSRRWIENNNEVYKKI